jgi:Putative polyhydroxyalkanoic acid system protein (PHA_gran_rgn)
MPNIVVSVPHQLVLSEVCRRIATWLASQPAIRSRWQGDRLHFRTEVSGKTIAGEVVASTLKVTAVVVLPWLFIGFGPVVKKRLAQELRKLLKP